MELRHIILPQFHNSGANLPLMNVAVLWTACKAAGFKLKPIDYRLKNGILKRSNTIRMNYKRHVGELMDLQLIICIIEAYRKGTPLNNWKFTLNEMWSYTLQTGIDTEIIIDEINSLYDCGIKAAEENKNADIVSFTAYVSNILTIVACALRLRQISNAKIIIGGPSVTQSTHTRRLFQLANISDYLVCGDGEHSFIELLKSIESNKEFNYKGIFNRESNIPTGSLSYKNFNFNETVFPEFDYLNWSQYQPFSITAEASRSCPANCAFCSEQDMHGPFQARKPGALADYLYDLSHKYRISRIYFVDSTFNFSKIWLSNFCNEMINRFDSDKMPVWACQYRADDCDIDLDLLIRSGFRACNVGVESFDDSILDAMHKSTRSDYSLDLIKLLLSKGINVNVNIVTGFPGETQQAYLNTLERLKSLIQWTDDKSLIRLLNVNFSSFHIRPGSIVYKEPEKYDIRIINHNPDKWTFKISEDLLNLAKTIPNEFYVKTPNENDRLNRRTLMISEIKKEMKRKSKGVHFDWRGESVVNNLIESDVITINKDLRWYSESLEDKIIYYCETWFGTHPFISEQKEIIFDTFGGTISLGEAIRCIQNQQPNESADGIKKFVSHLIANGILILNQEIAQQNGPADLWGSAALRPTNR